MTAYYLLLIRLQTDRILQNGISAVSITLLSGRGLAAAGVQQPGVWRTGIIEILNLDINKFGKLILQLSFQAIYLILRTGWSVRKPLWIEEIIEDLC